MQVAQNLQSVFALKFIRFGLQPFINGSSGTVWRFPLIFSINRLMQQGWDTDYIFCFVKPLRRDVVCILAALGDDVMVLITIACRTKPLRQIILD